MNHQDTRNTKKASNDWIEVRLPFRDALDDPPGLLGILHWNHGRVCDFQLGIRFGGN